VHESQEKITDKVAQNNINYEMRADGRNRLSNFNIGDVVNNYILVVLIHFKS